MSDFYCKYKYIILLCPSSRQYNLLWNLLHVPQKTGHTHWNGMPIIAVLRRSNSDQRPTSGKYWCKTCQRNHNRWWMVYTAGEWAMRVPQSHPIPSLFIRCCKILYWWSQHTYTHAWCAQCKCDSGLTVRLRVYWTNTGAAAPMELFRNNAMTNTIKSMLSFFPTSPPTFHRNKCTNINIGHQWK